jgi:ketosteroid isomerase-like protein
MNSSRANAEIASQLLATPPGEFDGKVLAERWLTEDFTLHYPGSAPIPFARLWQGRQGFVDFMACIAQELNIERMDIGPCEGAGDHVYVSGTTFAKAIRTGKAYQSAWLLVWTFRDGKIANMVEYHDTQAIAKAFC